MKDQQSKSKACGAIYDIIKKATPIKIPTSKYKSGSHYRKTSTWKPCERSSYIGFGNDDSGDELGDSTCYEELWDDN